MDDKTAELRDVFLDVADEETVTERQSGGRGTLAGDDGSVTEALAEVVAEMRERFDFATDLPDGALVEVVTRFYRGADDDAIADGLSSESVDATGDAVDAAAVARARWDLHLLREDELAPPVARADLASAADAAADLPELAEDVDVPAETLRRYREILRARREALRVNHRYTAEFERLLEDSELSDALTAHETGLAEATEGQEIADDVDLSF